MELCSLLGIVVDTNLCLAHRFFAVMENSCVQYPEMPYTSVTRIGKLKVFFSFLKNTTVLINVLKVWKICKFRKLFAIGFLFGWFIGVALLCGCHSLCLPFILLIILFFTI